jgi:hypothetical protein
MGFDGSVKTKGGGAAVGTGARVGCRVSVDVGTKTVVCGVGTYPVCILCCGAKERMELGS